MTWYFYPNKIGPITSTALKELALQGKITPQTVIETEQGKLAKAENVRGLVFSSPENEEISPIKPKSEPSSNLPIESIPSNSPPVQEQAEETIPTEEIEQSQPVDFAPFISAMQGTLDDVLTAIEQIGGINAINEYGRTPLHSLIKLSSLFLTNESAIYAIIEKGANVNARDQDGQEPLHCCIPINAECNPNIMASLIKAGAIIDAQDNDGNSTLHLALQNGRIETTLFLLNEGANAELKNRQERTPYQLAQCQIQRKSDKPETREALQTLAKKLNIDYEEPFGSLYEAIIADSPEGIAFLIKKGADIWSSEHGFSHIHLAAACNNVNALMALKNAGLSVNIATAENEEPLHIALRHKSRDAAIALIKLGANVNAINKNYGAARTPLEIAIKNEIIDVIAPLIKAGANTNEAVKCAIKYKSTASITALIKQGIKIDPTSNLICHAAEHNATQIIPLLLDAGCEINKDFGYGSPLHCAIEKGAKETIKLLIDAGADVNAISKREGKVPLHVAVENNSSDILELLVKAGANLEIKDSKGNTPMTLAIEKGASNLFSILLKAGATIPENISNHINLKEDSFVLVLAKAGINVDFLYARGLAFDDSVP